MLMLSGRMRYALADSKFDARNIGGYLGFGKEQPRWLYTKEKE